MNLDDSHEQAIFRAEARAWLDANVDDAMREGLAAGDRSGSGSHEKAWLRKLHDGGWAGITWPIEYGGRGLGPVEQMIWNQELARARVPTTAGIVGFGMAGPTIIAHGTAEQRSRYLQPMLRGDELWCQLFSEPEAGSDLASLTTRAERRGDEWVINGQKVWSSGAHYADRGILLARTDPTVPKHRGITYFLCDVRAPGVEVRPLRQITGHAHFNEVFLTDVRVPARDVLGEVDGGWRVATTTLLNERMALGGVDGFFSFDELADLVRRTRPGGAGPVLRQEMARLYSWVRALDLLNARVMTKLRRGEIPESEGSVMKLALGRIVGEGASLALDALGAWAGVEDGPEGGRWQRAFLSAPALRIGGGTDEIQRNIIGERVLGLPREERPDRDVPFNEMRAARGGR